MRTLSWLPELTGTDSKSNDAKHNQQNHQQDKAAASPMTLASCLIAWSVATQEKEQPQCAEYFRKSI